MDCRVGDWEEPFEHPCTHSGWFGLDAELPTSLRCVIQKNSVSSNQAGGASART